MKLQSVLSCLLMMISLPAVWGQAIEILLESGDYPAIVQHYEERGDELTNEELYMVGLAYFQLEKDQKAIELYDKAIANGLDEHYVYLYKGLALRYDNQHEASIASLRKAVERKPDSQINYTELGNGFFYAEQYDSALVYLSQARGMAFELGDPYLRVPLIYEIQEQYEKALEEYKISAELMDKTDPAYVEILASMGMLHHTAFKDYSAAIEAYNQALQVAPDLYNLYPLLIQAYNANGAYAKGDSLFEPLRVAYQEGGLAEDYQEMGSAGIEEFVWKGKSVVVHKYFEQPKETLDYIYLAYILKENTDSIDFMIMTEKTLQFMEDSPKHLLCGKQPGGGHFTYSYGWSEDDIPYASFREALLLVMNDKINPAASSNFSAAPAEEDASKKKKKRKKKD